MDSTRATRVFEMLVRQNEAMLITYIRALVPDASLADDIFQDTMITAWRKFDDYDQTRPLGPWLRGIAANLIRNAGRKKAADLLIFSESVQEFIETAVGALERQPGDEWADRMSELQTCLEQLPDRARQLIRDRYDEGMNAVQIAGKMEVSAASVRKRLQRIRDVLLKCLCAKLPRAKDHRIMSEELAPEEIEQFRAEQQLLHALLTGLHEAQQSKEDRVAAALARFQQLQQPSPTLESPNLEPESQDMSGVQVQPDAGRGFARNSPRRRVVRWIGMAAAVMLAGLFWNHFLHPERLDAAVERVEIAAAKPVTRVYDISFHAEFRRGNLVTRRGRMYTKSTDHFVVQLGDRKMQVLGTDGVDEWYVSGPRYGIIADEPAFRAKTAFLEDRMHRFMLANKFLETLSDDYDLTLLDEPTPRGVDHSCTALLGTRIAPKHGTPREVRVWADGETGVALRLELTWEAALTVKPHRMVMEFVGEKTVSDDFYTLEHHVAQNAPNSDM